MLEHTHGVKNLLYHCRQYGRRKQHECSVRPWWVTLLLSLFQWDKRRPAVPGHWRSLRDSGSAVVPRCATSRLCLCRQSTGRWHSATSKHLSCHFPPDLLIYWLTYFLLLIFHLASSSYYAGAPSATLATGTPARRLQGGHVRPSVAVWHFGDVLSRRLPSCRRCSWTTTTLHREPNMRRCPDIQQFWRQSLCSCGPRTMEQSSIAPKRSRLIVQSIPAVAKDIFVWIVGPRSSVNYFNCAA